MRLFLANFLSCLTLYFLIIHWLGVNATRSGAVLSDPLHQLLSPRDFSPYIFAISYSPILIFICWIAQYPTLLHRAFTVFTAVFAVRAVCIYLIPLSPPVGLIPLDDPIINTIADEGHVLNDLFFSGHVADLCTLCFIARVRWLRLWLATAAVIVGLLLVWQRVHYTVDVIAAPIFTYLCYWILVKKDVLWGGILSRIEGQIA